MPLEANIYDDEDGRLCLTIMPDEDEAAKFEEIGLQGGGYTLEGLYEAIIRQKEPVLLSSLEIGAEADNMYVYSRKKEDLEKSLALLSSLISNRSLLEEIVAQGDIE